MDESLQSLSLEQKLNFLSILICLANQDGDLDTRESKMIQSVIEKLGVSEEEINQLPIVIPVIKIKSYAESLKGTNHQEFFIKQMVDLAKSDSRFLKEEENLLVSVGKILEIGEEKLKEMIEG